MFSDFSLSDNDKIDITEDGVWKTDYYISSSTGDLPDPDTGYTSTANSMLVEIYFYSSSAGLKVEYTAIG